MLRERRGQTRARQNLHTVGRVVIPQTNADFVAPCAAAAQDVGRRTDVAVNADHAGVENADALGDAKAPHDFAAAQHQRRRNTALHTRREAKSRAFPNERGFYRVPLDKVREVVIHHGLTRRGQEPHGPAVVPVGAFPNHIKRILGVVFIAFIPLGIHSDVPTKAITKLGGAVFEHRVR